MKVRARVKQPEYLPEWAHCCEERLDHLRTVNVVYAYTSQCESFGGGICRFCGQMLCPEGLDVMVTNAAGETGWFRMELLDLDEGPLEAQ